jgi:predicted nucleotidyltransferase
MEGKLNTLGVFFEHPNKGFLIREVSRLVKINHTTIRLHLNEAVKEGILRIENNGLYPEYKFNSEKKGINLKLYYNLEKIRLSGILEYLDQIYDYPTIVLFGSYSKALDDENSDIDIFIYTQSKKEVTLDRYAKQLKRKISLHLFNERSWNMCKSKNPALVNSICNGITLSGQLEVL